MLTLSPTPLYRHDLDGLRGVAIALVAVFHVWFGRVSGGVDVFLVLSGFFVQVRGWIKVLSFLLILPWAFAICGSIKSTSRWRRSSSHYLWSYHSSGS